MARTLPAGSTIVLASHNRGKLAELTPLLTPFGITALSAADLGLPEPEETAPDFYGNARLKALAAATATGMAALADDSGFCVAALAGAPGVLSARWAGEKKDFAAAMARVRHESEAATDRRAWFVCVLCLAWPDGHTDSFQGRVDGTMVWPPRGTLGFGYDPIFVPAGANLTFGEMDPAAKHAISHRARAFAQLKFALTNAPTRLDQPWSRR
jgi:XTP/dITP diphosphohydrolase